MENNETLTSLQALLFVLRKRIAYVLAIGVAVALVFALVTVFFITPIYSSTAKFYVNNIQGQSTAVSSQDMNASKSLAESSIVIVKQSTSLLERVIEESGVGISAKALKNSITTGTYSGTEAFYISVDHADPEKALAIANAFYTVIPSAIPEIINKGDVSQMDPPRLAREPDSPNVAINTVIGAILGIAVSFLVFFLVEVLDNTIYTEDDVKDKFGYPIVGLIPTIVTEEAVRTKRVKGRGARK